MGHYSRNNAGAGVWSGQNNSDQGLTIVTNVTGLQVNGTVTITATYTGSVTQVNLNGYAITSGILTPDGSTITAPVGLGGEVGQDVFVSIVDDNGQSTTFVTTLLPETGTAAVKGTLATADLPENSLMFGEPGINVGDILVYETLTDTAHPVTINSEFVLETQLPAGVHTIDTSWRDGQTAGYDATATQVLTITVVDGEPDAFAFAGYNRCGPDLSYSESVPLTGMNDGESLYVTNGRVSNNGGISYTKSVIPYVTGQTLVQAEAISDSTPGNSVVTPVTVNGVSANYTLVTATPDVDAFVLPAQTDLPFHTPIDTPAIAITGTAGTYDIEVRGYGAKFSVNGGAFQTGFVAGGVNVGDSVVFRMESMGKALESNSLTAIIDGRVAVFTTTTQADSANHIELVYEPEFDQPLNTLVESGLVFPTGDAGTYAISVENGEYNIGSTTWETDPSTYTIGSGLSINVRHTTSANSDEDTATVVTLGDHKAGFVTTTQTITNIDPFSFTSQTDVPVSDLRVSNTITPTGIAGTYSISVSNGEYSIDGEAFTSSPGTFTIGSTLALRHTSSASNSTPTVTTVTIDSQDGTFTSTTEAAPILGIDSITIPSKVALINTNDVESLAATINGNAGTYDISIESVHNAEYRVNVGTWVSTPTVGGYTLGDTVEVRIDVTTAGTYTVDLTIDGTVGTYEVTVLDPDAPLSLGTADKVIQAGIIS